MDEIVFSQYTIDFSRVALEFCLLIEKTKETDKKIFIANMTKVLPLLYLKASIVPTIRNNSKSILPNKVCGNLYSQVEKNIEELLENDNLYLETFHTDISLSDFPVVVKISEDLANIYQDLGNFISVFKNGYKKTMSDSLFLCIKNFKKYWGQRATNALRALHNIKYRSEIQE